MEVVEKAEVNEEVENRQANAAENRQVNAEAKNRRKEVSENLGVDFLTKAFETNVSLYYICNNTHCFI